jgi:hypothetical protein
MALLPQLFHEPTGICEGHTVELAKGQIFVAKGMANRLQINQ